jgi:WD40 repeat protein
VRRWRPDGPAGAAGSNLRIRNRARLGPPLSCGAKSDSRSCAGLQHARARFALSARCDSSRCVLCRSTRQARATCGCQAQKEIAVLRGHSDVVWSAAFSRDGSRIVTASTDKAARIWDAASAHELAVLRGLQQLHGTVFLRLKTVFSRLDHDAHMTLAGGLL